MDLLVVEDDDAVGEALVRGLRREGFAVERVATGSEAIAAKEPDLVLLDLGLPDMDGYDVCRRLQSRSQVPVIIVSARSEEEDRVRGLGFGADDYLVKPFGFRELVARIEAVARRRQHRPVSAWPKRIGALELDRRSRKVTLDGQIIELTPKEFEVLVLLAEEAGTVLSREQILERAWGHPWYGPTKTLDVHVAAIRRKLGDPTWIETVRSVGFRLVPKTSPQGATTADLPAL
jgi:two-component system, OmpR family, response regulator RegX3